MARKKKKNIRADVSENTGVVLLCPRCEQRTWTADKAEAWRWLYRHLRDVHNEMNAAKITHSARQQSLR